jgi:hypothetical protein
MSVDLNFCVQGFQDKAVRLVAFVGFDPDTVLANEVDVFQCTPQRCCEIDALRAAKSWFRGMHRTRTNKYRDDSQANFGLR